MDSPQGLSPLVSNEAITFSQETLKHGQAVDELYFDRSTNIRHTEKNSLDLKSQILKCQQESQITNRRL